MLISFEEGKRHLNVDHEADDVLIQDMIDDASEIVLDYCKLPLDSWQDTGGSSVNVPRVIRVATLLVLTALYENRDAANADPLSQAVKDLLHRHRDPAMA